MLQNNNKKFIKVLSGNCLKANKHRNLIAIAAILLTAMLFTSIATVLQGTIYCIKEQRIRQSGSAAMVSLKYMPEDKCQKIISASAFDKVGKMRYVGESNDPKLERLSVNLAQMDENLYQMSYMDLKEGSLPEKADEVALDTAAMDLLGLPHESGQTFTLHYKINDDEKFQKVTISGFWEGSKDETNTYIGVSKAFADQALKGYPKPKDSEALPGALVVMGTLKSDQDLQQQLDAIVKEAGYDPKAQVGEDGFLRANVNNAYLSPDKISPQLLAGLTAAGILILIAGYLIIYNIFQISVLKDIRFYGQLKTIGASPKQLAYIVKKQGMRLSIIGIPAGLILGWLLGNALLPMIMESLDGRSAYFVSPNLWVMLASAAFALFTVWVSCKKPGRTAARISPIEALKYSGQKDSKKVKKHGKESKMRIAQMALANLSSNKGKTVLVVLSISLSMVILNSALNFAACFDKETFAKGQTAADFVVNSAALTQSDAASYTIPEPFIKYIEKQEGIEDLSKVYYHHEPQNQAAAHEIAQIKSRNGKPYQDENDLGGKQVYGFDEAALKRCKIVSGQLNLEKFATGNYVLEIASLTDNGQEPDPDMFTLKPGDKVKASFQGEVREYEVMAQAACNIALLYPGSYGDFGGLLLNEKEFASLYPQEMQPIRCVFDAKRGCLEQVESMLADYLNRPQAGIMVKSRATVDQSFEGLKQTYSISGMVVACIFGVIGLLNLLNVILTGAIARKREFAIMQSVGMTRKQLRRLFILEGGFYALAASLMGIFLSAVVSLTVVRGLTSGWWFAVYHLTILPACLAAPVYVLAAIIISALIDRLWNKGSVVERLRTTK